MRHTISLAPLSNRTFPALSAAELAELMGSYEPDFGDEPSASLIPAYIEAYQPEDFEDRRPRRAVGTRSPESRSSLAVV